MIGHGKPFLHRYVHKHLPPDNGYGQTEYFLTIQTNACGMFTSISLKCLDAKLSRVMQEELICKV